MAGFDISNYMAGQPESPWSDLTYAGGLAATPAASSPGGISSGFFDNLGQVITGGLTRWIDVEGQVRLAQAGTPAVNSSNSGAAEVYRVNVPAPNNQTIMIVLALVAAVYVLKGT